MVHLGLFLVSMRFLEATTIDPQLTAEKFIEIPGRGRWYRTGDGGVLHGNELEVVGRFDSQVLWESLGISGIDGVGGNHGKPNDTWQAWFKRIAFHCIIFQFVYVCFVLSYGFMIWLISPNTSGEDSRYASGAGRN